MLTYFLSFKMGIDFDLHKFHMVHISASSPLRCHRLLSSTYPIEPLNTQKPLLYTITFFPVPHNGLVILRVNAIVDVHGPISNYGLPNYFGLYFPFN